MVVSNKFQFLFTFETSGLVVNFCTFPYCFALFHSTGLTMADSEDMGMTGEEQLDSLDQMEGGEGDVGDNGDIGELDANHAGAGMDDPVSL